LKVVTSAVVTLVGLTGCILPYPHTSDRSVEYHGTVLDARTRAPIKGAKVVFKDTGDPITSRTTNAAGHFRYGPTHNFHVAEVGFTELKDWPPGHSIDGMTVSHPGYVSQDFHNIWGGEVNVLLEPEQ
jgi:hypothetical protein